MFPKFSSTEKNMDKKGVSRFSVEIFFVPNRRKTSWAKHFFFQKYSGIKSFSIIGVSEFCRNFLSHIAKNLFFCLTVPNFLWGTLQRFIKTWSSKNFMHKIGVHRLSVEKFKSHSTEKFRRVIFVFRKSSCIGKLLDNKVARFCRLFLSHSAENFVENPPMIQKN